MSFEKSFEHRERLLEAALTEFADQGFVAASINRILRQAGMSKGQFYYHFKDKEGLYFAAIEVLIARKQAFLSQHLSPADLQQDIFSLLQTQIRLGLEFARQYPLINRFSERFVKEKGNPIYHKTLAHYNFEENDGLKRLIDLAHERGDFRADLPLPFIRHVIAYLSTNVVELVNLDDQAEFEQSLTHFITFLKSGLAQP